VSGHYGCRNPDHRQWWRVSVYKANYSAFNGYHRTPSDYSEVVCIAADAPALCTKWRTKAAYVDGLPMYDPTEPGPQSPAVANRPQMG
jgi:hypothetical protein